MQTTFSLAQLADPNIEEAESILRAACIAASACHLPDLSGARQRARFAARTNLPDQGHAGERQAGSSEVALHIDRCLSCLSCVTTCPSGVDYMHLVDQARVRIEKTFRRPLHDRLLRGVLACDAPYRGRFRVGLIARATSPSRSRRSWSSSGRRAPAWRRCCALPRGGSRASESCGGACSRREAARRARVALLDGCAQPVLDPGINSAAIRLLNRFGVEVVLPKGDGCCGAIVHHMGREKQAHALAAQDDRRMDPRDRGRGPRRDPRHHLRLRHDDQGLRPHVPPRPGLCGERRRESRRSRSTSPNIWRGSICRQRTPPERMTSPTIPPARMQHGQRITTLPKQLLEHAGFAVRDIPEGHICCGSAGTYNILQPEIAARLRDRKVANIETGRAGRDRHRQHRLHHADRRHHIPVLHTVELLDWVTGWSASRSPAAALINLNARPIINLKNSFSQPRVSKFSLNWLYIANC